MKLYSPKLTPKDHQVVGIQELRARRIGNFDDPGMGKAKQAYDTVALLFQDHEIELAIVVMSSALRENFLGEVRSDTDQLVAKVVDGSKAQRMKLYRYPGCHILIMSYETLVRDLHEVVALTAAFKTFVALDEAHKIKNPDSQVSNACLEVASAAHKTAIFTGTPIPNSVRDVYPQLKFLGLNVGDTYEEFREKFPSLASLREFIVANSLRRKKTSVAELSGIKKNVQKVVVKLSQEERRIYDEISENLYSEFRGVYGGVGRVHIRAVITKLLRLVQFASNPGLLGADLGEVPSKILALKKLVDSILACKGEKVVVWTGYRHNVDVLMELLKAHAPVKLVGGMSREELKATTDQFQKSDSCRVLIAIPACAREGFTLTSARHAVYLDRNFSALDWLQSQDRIHRLSQKREVFVHVLEAEDTIDEKIDGVLTRKEALQSYLVGDTDDIVASPMMNQDEVRDLFSVSRAV